MKESIRDKRETEIAKAAYDVIERKGYSGASMLSIARKARASNETLYNWYGDKTGLFRALIVRNTYEVRDHLEKTARKNQPPLQVLRKTGPVLLTMLLGDRAIALNRAAAADTTGTLGPALADAGRDTVAPLIGEVLRAARSNGDLAFEDLEAALETYIGLLVGDLQIRRVTGALGPLSETEISKRCKQAEVLFLRLFAPVSHTKTPPRSEL